MNNLFFLSDFKEEEKQRTGQYLNYILLSSIGLLVVLYATRLAEDFNLSSPTNLFLSGLLVILISLRVVAHYGHVRIASLLLVSITWIAMTYQAYSADGIRDVTITAYIVIILMASLLLGWQYSLPFFGFSVGAMWVMANQESSGVKTFSLDDPINTATNLTIIFTLIIILVYLIVSNLQRSINKAKASAQELKLSNDELQTLRKELEQRVADRTKALQTSAEATRRLAAVTNPRQLAAAVVEEVQSAFNYYHVHIYFADEITGDLIMAGGTGEAGAAMLARGHRVQKRRGLVGRAAETNSPVLAPDVSKAADWLPNPLLPDTLSEVAIPIASGKQVLGVLDVQQNVVNGLGEDDMTLLQSLAGQVAISLQNARSFEQAKAQAELESLVNVIGQKIQRAETVEETLQTAMRELSLALGASRVAARLGSPHEDSGKLS